MSNRQLVILNWRDLEHPEAGGAEVVCQELAASYATQGHDVVLLCAAVAGKARWERRDGYSIRRAGGRFTVYPRALLWLRVNRRRISAVIDSQNGIPFFAPLAMRRDTPIVMLLHHVHQHQFGLYFPGPIAAVGRFLESTGSRLVYRRRAIVAVSPSTRREARLSLGLKGNISVAPPGWRLGDDAPEPGSLRTLHPTITTVGRLVPHKRTMLVIEAVDQLRGRHPELKLDVIGSGTELDVLKRFVAERNLTDTVTFHPDCGDEERDALVASSWLTVNASVGEGWGLSVIEANALGTPVLAFDRPGLRDSIRSEVTGWLIPERGNLADAISRAISLLASRTTAHTMAVASRVWADTFTWEAMASKVMNVVSSERARITRTGPERRMISDVSTVVSLPVGAVPESWSPNLRRQDSLVIEGDQVVLLLNGVDTHGAAGVLQRLGVSREVVQAQGEIRVARAHDHLLYFDRHDAAMIATAR